MISIIIPFFNEKKNLPLLLDKLLVQLIKIKKEYEIIFVDDGSTDDGAKSISQSDTVRVEIHRKRFGKGKALKTGISAAKGDIIVLMDADLQNDPKDLPAMLKKLDSGYDLVNGIRVGRHSDNFVLGSYSLFAEKFLKNFLESPYSDINCGFKVFRRSVLSGFVFYGNNFRFFPLGVYYSGYKVTEMPVTDNARLHGKSKFGPGKLLIGIFDTLTAYFIYRFAERPLHFFGPVGSVIFLSGFLLSLYLTIERLFFNVLLITRPILWLGLLLIIIGIQIMMTGVIGELIVYLNKKKN